MRAVVGNVRFEREAGKRDGEREFVNIPLPSRFRRGEFLVAMGRGWKATTTVTDPAAGYVRAVRAPWSEARMSAESNICRK